MATTLDSLLIAVGPNDRDHVNQLLDEAIAVAEPTGAKVILLHVFSEDEYEELLNQLDIEPGRGALGSDELAARHDSIKTPAGELKEAGIEYEVHGTVGETVTEIIRFAEEQDVDRLFIGGEKRSPTGKAMFGDHAQSVLLNATCPVTYVQRD